MLALLKYHHHPLYLVTGRGDRVSPKHFCQSQTARHALPSSPGMKICSTCEASFLPLRPSPSVSHGASYRSTSFVCIMFAMGMTPKAPRGDPPQFSSVMFLNVECHHHPYASFSISDVHILVHKVYSAAFVLRRERRTKNRCPNNKKKIYIYILIV